MALTGRQKEIWRKITQIGFGIAVLLAAYYASVKLVTIAVGVLAVLFLICDVLMVDYGVKLPIWSHLERKHEQAVPHAATLMLFGANFALAFYDEKIALASIAAQSFGDSLASITRGLKPFRGKKPSVTMLIASLVSAYLITKNPLISATIGIVAWLAEGASRLIDDNLTVPVLSGAAGQVLTLASKMLS